MKHVITLLLFALLLSSSLAAANGTITGTVYLPNTERGVHAGPGGMMWDISAPKNRKNAERAEVWLIEQNINFHALPYASVQKWYQEGKIPEGQPIYHVEVNEKGHFTFQDVPAADYYVMILDPNGQESTQNLTEKISRDELLQKLPHTDEFELFMIGMRTCLVQKVSLKNGQNIKIRPGFL
ncbi:hypothetical protein SAMN05216582_103159 [Selenomonas ruminantium]|uniref:Carboxypeptidase regulatory-like domain-containing protein n=1 Tax=Selenomonas ruminantium TaxID=971 RepID=A0A1M6S7L0_SELRU|nr:hypothetical protein [Selenomonas ruminantium]SHK40680.1 hypothetical protein SAMN05216582_103159 [Selenomonas ruminantium]